MHTFVIRVYTGSRDAIEDDGRLRGVVEEVATGFRATFHGTSELLAILGRQPQGPAGVEPRKNGDISGHIKGGAQ